MKKDLLVKILSAIALALVVLGLIYLVQKKEKKEKEKEKKTVSSEEFVIPPLLEKRKTFKITDAAKNFFKGKEQESAKEITIYVPKGVEPHYINIKKAEVGYFIELFKYREVAEGVIAHSLNISATDPHRQFTLALAFPEKTIGGVVVEIDKTTFKINNPQPGGKNSKIYKIKVLPDTVFTKIDIVKTTKETKAGFSILALDQSVVVHYTQNSEELKAQKVDILWNYQLPIVRAPKQ